MQTGVAAEEEEQADGPDIEFYKLGFVSKSGFTADMPDDRYSLITLDELYEA